MKWTKIAMWYTLFGNRSIKKFAFFGENSEWKNEDKKFNFILYMYKWKIIVIFHCWHRVNGSWKLYVHQALFVKLNFCRFVRSWYGCWLLVAGWQRYVICVCFRLLGMFNQKQFCYGWYVIKLFELKSAIHWNKVNLPCTSNYRHHVTIMTNIIEIAMKPKFNLWSLP